MSYERLLNQTKLVKQTKVCRNKGKPRFWLEGKFLTESGFACGDRFDFTIVDGAMTIKRVDGGQRKIAGTNTRPIIDMIGKVPAQLGEPGQPLKVERIADGLLLVTRRG